MTRALKRPFRPYVRRRRWPLPPSEVPVDLEADNVELRAALAAAQKLLIDTGGRPARLIDLVESALTAFCANARHCVASGPDVFLDGRRAHALALALHALASNATKYGALSVETGRVEVTWTLDANRLSFFWREEDGPVVSTPERSGWGTQIITRHLADAFEGEVSLTFPAEGVECHLRAP